MSNEHKSCATPFKTMIGGQALIEGIMMMGPEKKAIVVRKPDGELEEKVEDRVLIKDKYPILGLPFIRGIFSFGSSMANGVKALMYSASFFPEDEEEEEEPSKFEIWLEKHLGSEKAASFFVTLAVILGMAFSVGLFILLPTALVGAGAALAGGMPPLRNQLPLCGHRGGHSGVQRGVLLHRGDQHLRPHGPAPADAAHRGGHYLRDQPLGGRPRQHHLPGRPCAGAVDAELHHLRAGRLHDRGGYPLPDPGAAQREGKRRLVRRSAEPSAKRACFKPETQGSRPSRTGEA